MARLVRTRDLTRRFSRVKQRAVIIDSPTNSAGRKMHEKSPRTIARIPTYVRACFFYVCERLHSCIHVTRNGEAAEAEVCRAVTLCEGAAAKSCLTAGTCQRDNGGSRGYLRNFRESSLMLLLRYTRSIKMAISVRPRAMRYQITRRLDTPPPPRDSSPELRFLKSPDCNVPARGVYRTRGVRTRIA